MQGLYLPCAKNSKFFLFHSVFVSVEINLISSLNPRLFSLYAILYLKELAFISFKILKFVLLQHVSMKKSVLMGYFLLEIILTDF